MKQIKSEDISSNSAKLSVRKVGTILGSGAICVLLAGTVSVAGLFDNNDKAVKTQKDNSSVVINENSETQTEKESEYTSRDTVALRKASINEYEIAQTKKVSETTKETTAKATTTAEETTAEETQKVSETTARTTAAAKKKAAETTAAQTTAKSEKTVKKTAKKNVSKTMYVNDDGVNFRSEPSVSAKILATLNTGDKVTVTSEKNNGWYAVSYNGDNGYVSADYLSAKEVAKKSSSTETKTKAATSTTPSTTYNSSTISYTDEEFEMLCYVLQGEVGNCSEASKIAVANIIINRVKSSSFPNTISGVLTANNQFTAINGYYNRSTTPSENTIACAKRALNGEDNTNGAIFYYAPKYCGGSTAAWFETLQFCMELDGQRYFKNW